MYPTDVAVCPVSRRVLVADAGNHRIQVITLFTQIFGL